MDNRLLLPAFTTCQQYESVSACLRQFLIHDHYSCVWIIYCKLTRTLEAMQVPFQYRSNDLQWWFLGLSAKYNLGAFAFGCVHCLIGHFWETGSNVLPWAPKYPDINTTNWTTHHYQLACQLCLQFPNWTNGSAVLGLVSKLNKHVARYKPCSCRINVHGYTGHMVF